MSPQRKLLTERLSLRLMQQFLHIENCPKYYESLRIL